MFAGLYSDYWGRDAAIFRSLGRLAQIRTEHDDERLLKGGVEEKRVYESELKSKSRADGKLAILIMITIQIQFIGFAIFCFFFLAIFPD